MWDLTSVQSLWDHEESLGAFQSVAFSPDGKRVLTGDDHNTAAVWDADTGKRLSSFAADNQYVCCVAFMQDDKRVVLADSVPVVWDIDNHKVRRLLNGRAGGIHSLAVSPDGCFLLTGAYDGMATMWRLATGEVVATLMPLNGGDDWVAFTPDGDYDGSEGGRKLVVFRSGDELTTMSSHYRPNLLRNVMMQTEREGELSEDIERKCSNLIR